MKKVLILCLLFFAFSFGKADQLYWLTLEQAQKAVKQLRTEESVILWCACCKNEDKKYVIITKVYMEKIKDDDNYYCVLIDGVTPDGEIISKEPLDLAYVHVKKKKNKNIYESLGKKLKFNCDPCTKPFSFTRI